MFKTLNMKCIHSIYVHLTRTVLFNCLVELLLIRALFMFYDRAVNGLSTVNVLLK